MTKVTIVSQAEACQLDDAPTGSWFTVVGGYRAGDGGPKVYIKSNDTIEGHTAIGFRCLRLDNPDGETYSPQGCRDTIDRFASVEVCTEASISINL